LSADWLAEFTGAGALTVGFDAHAASRPARVEIFEGDRRVAARTLDLRATWQHRDVTLAPRWRTPSTTSIP